MPTYEYACEKCGHHFERFQSISDVPLTRCPKDLCPMKVWGKGKVKRVIGAAAGLIFKGSGFYITDCRGDKYKERATIYPNLSRLLDIRIEPGSAPPEKIAEVLSEISKLYRMVGGAGIHFTPIALAEQELPNLSR